VLDEVDALLLVEPADVGDDRLELLPQPQPLPQRLLVCVLVIEGVEGVVVCDVLVDLGVPDVVVDPVQDPAELAPVDRQRVPQPHALVGVQRFPGVLGRHRGHEVGVHDAALQQVQRAGVEVVA
jgi:hypothetical protein